jgi:hypothetical protein
MGSPQVIMWMIAGCAAFVLFLFFYKVFVKIFKFLLKGAIGGIGFLICNALLSTAGISASVGVNVVTVLVTAFLGLPGFITLYAAQFVLK